MSKQSAYFIFKLRKNIALEGDLALAKMELHAFIKSDIEELPDIRLVAEQVPELSNLPGLTALEAQVRTAGTQAFTANTSLETLPVLIRSVSFVQNIYCVTQDSDAARELLSKMQTLIGSVFSFYSQGKTLVIQALPHYALIEVSDVIASRSKEPLATKQNLGSVLKVLLGDLLDKKAAKLAADALSAKSTTSHLSHDIHYYKAKFFPRMARSIINVCQQRLEGQKPKVIDNFVGSGTALLEASLLGIPSVGIDIDPLAVMIATAKLEAFKVSSESLFQEVTIAAQEVINQRTMDAFQEKKEKYSSIHFPAWLMKNRKMTQQIAEQLTKEINIAKAAIERCHEKVRKLFQVMLSDAILRKIRMRFMGTGVGRFSLTFAKTPLLDIFVSSLKKYVKVTAVYEWLKETIHLCFAQAKVICADARALPDNIGPFNILVTSPPYLPASSGRESYAKARALSLIALGLQNPQDVDELVDGSIGSMNGGNGIELEMLTSAERGVVEWLLNDKLRNIKAAPIARYFLDMRQAFKEMFHILLDGAFAVVIVGKKSVFYEFSTRKVLHVVNAAEILADEARKAGFEIDAMHDIQLDKSNMNARPRSLDDYYETLLILRKPATA